MIDQNYHSKHLSKVLVLFFILILNPGFSTSSVSQPFHSLQIESPGPSVWGDYDGDGDVDILTTSVVRSGGIGPLVYRNDVGLFKRIETGIGGFVAPAIDWGDYDSDGDLDVVVTGFQSSRTGPQTAAIYRNNGEGSFTDIGADLTPVINGSASWGDYDRDEDLDLVITGGFPQGETATIYRNEGGGKFVDINANLTGVTFSSSDWGDYDGDGDLDLVITGSRPTGRGSFPSAIIYRNEGDDFFSDIQADLVGVQHGYTDWGDYDRDGDLDLVVSGNGRSEYTVVYRNDGGESFVDTGAGIVGIGYGSSTWGDHDGDGDLDLIVAGNLIGIRGDGSILYRNEGSDTFIDTGSDLVGLSFSSSSWSDYDDDGDLDLLLSGGDALLAGKAETAVYQNNGDGSFSNPRLLGVFYGSSDWGDYDGDGDLDLVVAGNRNSQFDPDNFTTIIYRHDDNIFTNIEAGLLGISGVSDNGSSEWGDYDGDGDLDLLITGYATTRERVSVIYRNDGNNDFVDIEADLQGVQNGFGRWGDYDNDGDLDILIAGSRSTFDNIAVIYRNDENDTFTEIQTDLIASLYPSGDWGDYDDDGDLDLILSGTSARIYRNDGSSTFVDIEASLRDAWKGDCKWGDYDGDGDLDLVINGTEGGTTSIYRNDGNDTFTPIDAGVAGFEFGTANWGDFDGDGDLDLVLSGMDEGEIPQTEVYRNDGSDTFTDAEISLPGVANGASTWGDADGDGDLDLLLAGSGVAQLQENLRLVGRPTETNTVTVSTDGRVSFEETGIAVNFQGVSGSASVTVHRYDTPPTSTAGIPEAAVSSYRVVMEVDAGLLFGSGTEARFDADAFAGIINPSEVEVYSRPSSGGSTFTALRTRYDGEAGEIVADIVAFGEFVFASNTNPLPVELSGFTAEFSGSNVILNWTTASEHDNVGFDVERSTDGRAFTTVGHKDGHGTTTEAQSYRFVDADVPFADTLHYRLRQVDLDGTAEYSSVVTVGLAPRRFALLPNAPNPFSATTRLRYTLTEDGPVSLRVYDLLGRRVATLIDQEQPAGRYTVTLDGARLPSGTYFVRLRAGTQMQTQRIAVAR